jgi:Nucleotidyl transferase AbiEii toxin, Type IV TA system
MLDEGLWQSAVELERYLDSQKLPFVFIGGIALQRWGEPRMTSDIDATVVVPFGTERSVATEILKRYQSRIDDPISFATQARILLLQDLHGNRIDLSIGGMPFEERMLERASYWNVLGQNRIRTCSAEDLVILKAFASRPQDWIDIKNVIIRQAEKLNRLMILEELTPLVELKEEPEILTQLDHLFRN